MKINKNWGLLTILDAITLEMRPDGLIRIVVDPTPITAADMLSRLGTEETLSSSAILALRDKIVPKIRERSKADRGPQHVNDVLRSAGLVFGRQDRRKGDGNLPLHYRAKWSTKNVPLIRLGALSKLLESHVDVISARTEELSHTHWNDWLTEGTYKAFVVRTAKRPTQVVFKTSGVRLAATQSKLDIPDCLL